MYKPVCPVTTRPLDVGDPRPRHGPAIISSREAFDEIAVDFELTLYEDGDKSTLYWIPKEKIIPSGKIQATGQKQGSNNTGREKGGLNEYQGSSRANGRGKDG